MISSVVGAAGFVHDVATAREPWGCNKGAVVTDNKMSLSMSQVCASHIEIKMTKRGEKSRWALKFNRYQIDGRTEYRAYMHNGQHERLASNNRLAFERSTSNYCYFSTGKNLTKENVQNDRSSWEYVIKEKFFGSENPEPVVMDRLFAVRSFSESTGGVKESFSMRNLGGKLKVLYRVEMLFDDRHDYAKGKKSDFLDWDNVIKRDGSPFPKSSSTQQYLDDALLKLTCQGLVLENPERWNQSVFLRKEPTHQELGMVSRMLAQNGQASSRRELLRSGLNVYQLEMIMGRHGNFVEVNFDPDAYEMGDD